MPGHACPCSGQSDAAGRRDPGGCRREGTRARVWAPADAVRIDAGAALEGTGALRWHGGCYAARRPRRTPGSNGGRETRRLREAAPTPASRRKAPVTALLGSNPGRARSVRTGDPPGELRRRPLTDSRSGTKRPSSSPSVQPRFATSGSRCHSSDARNPAASAGPPTPWPCCRSFPAPRGVRDQRSRHLPSYTCEPSPVKPIRALRAALGGGLPPRGPRRPIPRPRSPCHAELGPDAARVASRAPDPRRGDRLLRVVEPHRLRRRELKIELPSASSPASIAWPHLARTRAKMSMSSSQHRSSAPVAMIARSVGDAYDTRHRQVCSSAAIAAPTMPASLRS